MSNDSDSSDDDRFFHFRDMRKQRENAKQERNKGGGSKVGKASNLNRFRTDYDKLLKKDYFGENPIYSSAMFRRRFRMRRSLFEKILDDLVSSDSYFSQKKDALGLLGFSPHQKLTSALRMLAYGTSADQLDDLTRMSESTTLNNLQHFCNAIINRYGKEYLRAPTKEDLEMILRLHEGKGWPGLLGSLDVMHWEWKNCPKAHRGAYQGKEGVATIALEAAVDCRLWFWHAWFGMPGANNDLNILDRSPFFHDLSAGRTPKVQFAINNQQHNLGYYLVDGIYPNWHIFVKTISEPQGPKRSYFSMRQEAQRKDVERAFGVLQARWRILALPCKLWSVGAMNSVIIACIILHNMIIEDEWETENTNEYLFDNIQDGFLVDNVNHDNVHTFLDFKNIRMNYMSEGEHFQLRNNLIEHLWIQYENK